ncbi:MAG: SrfA family protein, partial [Betaproteobacteria bacterium]
VADCLAIPQPNQHGSVIDWYAPNPGDVVPWSAATVQERELALAELDSAQGKLETAAQAMRDSFGGNSQTDREKNTALRLITKAFYFPDPNFIFLVSGRPVITFWGFNTLGASLPSDPFVGLRSTALAAPIPAASVSKRAWWWWLLLLLLLLLLMFVLLRSCAPHSWLTGLPFVTHTAPDTQNVRPVPVDATPKATDTVIDRGITTLRRWWSGQAGDTPIGSADSSAVVDRGTGGGNTEAGQSNAPGANATPEATAPTGSDPAPSPAPEQPAPTPAPDASQNGTPPATQALTPQESAGGNTSPNAGNPLQIPNSASANGSTNFLDGRWNAGAGIQDAKTGKPLRMEYDFSQGNGQGKVTIQRGDGARCAGDVAAQMQGRSLNINDRGVAKCSDGSTMALPKVTCVPSADGRADCQGRYDNGTSFPVSMRHAPK